MRIFTSLLALGALVVPSALPSLCHADLLQVGPARTYTTVRAAILAAQDGDVIEIDAGTYSADVATIQANGLTIRGVGGRAHLAAGGANEGGKAIWVVAGDDLVVEDVELSGAAVPDQNGAGIRLEGTNLTLRRCLFHDNEDGILAGDNLQSDVLIEDSEFRNNGHGDGYSHNIYINHVRTLTVRGSWFHHAKVGHELKSRAYTTILYANRFTNDADGTASYEVDLPNGGLAILVGNVLQQAASSQNPTLLSYAAEGASNPMQAIYVVNNTFVNERAAGSTFVRLVGTPTAVLTNNLFVGTGTVLMGTATEQGSLKTDMPGFVDRAAFDYHLVAGSPAVDVGVAAGTGPAGSLAPVLQAIVPLGSAARTQVGAALDIGAYEFGNSPGMNGPVETVPGADTGGCGCRTVPGAGGARAGSRALLVAVAVLVLGRARAVRRRRPTAVAYDDMLRKTHVGRVGYDRSDRRA